MQVCTCKTASYGCVHGFHDVKVGGEEDVKVALVDLQMRSAIVLLVERRL